MPLFRFLCAESSLLLDAKFAHKAQHVGNGGCFSVQILDAIALIKALSVLANIIRIRYYLYLKNISKNKMNSINNQPIKFFASFFFVLALTGITGCVDLSGAKYHATQKSAQQATNTSHRYHGEVHTMLGGLGVFSTGMKELSSSVEKHYNIPAPSNMWYNAGDVTRSIVTYYYQHKTHRPIILVGHSLGANEQIKVARNLDKAGIPVDLLVTVDAVSQTIIPPNVKHVMNFYKSGYVPMFSGLRVRAVNPEKTRIENINVVELKGVAVNHFTIDKDPVVQAMIMAEVKKVTRNANRAKD